MDGWMMDGESLNVGFENGFAGGGRRGLFGLGCVLGFEEAGHTQQSPRRLRRLRTHAQPILCAQRIESDVFEFLALAVGGELGDGIVGTEDFEGERIAS